MLLAIVYMLLPKESNFKVVNIKKYLLTCSLLVIMICIIIFSNSTYIAAKEGFMLWVNNIVPALFPFLICIDLLKHTNFINIIGKLLTPIMRPLFNVPGCGAFAVALGITSGYPVGAKISSELFENDECNKIEAERLLSFTNTSGPLFIISACGIGMFGNAQIGITLLITHFLASLTVGIVFRKYQPNPSLNSRRIITHKDKKINKNDKLCLSKLGFFMGNAIQNSITTLLLICGYIIFFAVLGDIFEELGIFEQVANAIHSVANILNIPKQYIISILKGIFEVTNGLKELANSTIEFGKTEICIAAFLLGFGGISVMMQVSSIISNSGLSIIPYILGKLLHGTIAATYTYVLLSYTNILNETLPAFSYSNSSSPVIINETSNLISCICGLLLLAIITKLTTYLINKRKHKAIKI